MTQVKLLPSDGHRPRKSDTSDINSNSGNIKLLPAGTSGNRNASKERRKQHSPRNEMESRNLSLPVEGNMRSGRSFYDNAGEPRSTAGGRSKRSSGSKPPSSRKRDRPRSASPRGNAVDDAHSVSLRPAAAAAAGGGGANTVNRGSKRQGVHLHSHHSRRKTSEGSRRSSWYGGDEEGQRGYSESSEEYVRVMGRASNGAATAYPKSILLSIRNGDELLAEVEANLSKMDFTVVTTALAQAVRLGCNGEDPRISALKDRSCELLRRRQQPRRADEIISSLHCILELSSSPAHCGEILSASTAAVSSRLRECTGDDLSNLCRCICKAEYLCPTLLTSITEECMARASELEPADISTIAWGLAKMGFGSDVLFQRLARVIEVTTHLFSGAYLSNLMWAFASVGYRSETMLVAVAQRCEELMGAVLESGEDEDVDRMALHPMEMSTLVWALSRLHAPSAEQFYLMVCEYTTANIELFKASELCTLVTGISRVSWKGQGDRTSPSNDANVVNPGQLPQPCRLMFQKCAEYVSSAPLSPDDTTRKKSSTAAVSFSDKQVRIFVTALAKVGLSHTRLFDCAQQRSDRRMARPEQQVRKKVSLLTAATPQRVSLVRSVDEDKPSKALPVARYPVEGRHRRSTSRGRMRASMPIDEEEEEY
ncbi:hypothetical protein FOL47_000308 [Perkinsus chesapeaki]|uniref:RNA-editing substrate-binding complex 6 protein domain-containing protein n=1 Tax=Perkinsus chesapeaki TaxID=330153 RepID=A0A7J6MN15_PERCH|nr:hypothetical protein FOL47_000308 [Perkinsus chesapeaki]